jgi:hypothetical protein
LLGVDRIVDLGHSERRRHQRQTGGGAPGRRIAGARREHAGNAHGHHVRLGLGLIRGV